MVLLIHIIIAISSVAYTTLLLIQPSHTKLRVSYALVAATLASGTYLTILNPAQMLHTCMAGLVYASLVTTGIMIARHKMIRTARQQAEQ
ncbi:MAG TPA: hypothetical protein VFM68_02220 [Candidatus Saccharimonadales bacterium]|nr:hypothetical protein [Candidatus Saccharimonadales bacterium]